MCVSWNLFAAWKGGGGGGKGREPGSLGLCVPARGSWSRVSKQVPWSPETWCGCFGTGYFPWEGCWRSWGVVGVGRSCWENERVEILLECLSRVNHWTLTLRWPLLHSRVNTLWIRRCWIKCSPFCRDWVKRVRLKMNHLQLATMAGWGCTAVDKGGCLYRNIIQTQIYILPPASTVWTLARASEQPWLSCMLPAWWPLSNVLLKGTHQDAVGQLELFCITLSSGKALAEPVLPGEQGLIIPAQNRHLSRGLCVKVSRTCL